VPSLNAVALFTLAALALLIVPGPAVLYVVTRSIEQGRRAGLTSVCGVATGGIVHVVAAALGLSAIVMTSATVFEAIKLAGALYLVVLGVRKVMHRSTVEAVTAGEPVALRRVYAQGVVVQVLNPKTALFFLAFLPQFVDPARGPVAEQILLLGMLFIVLGLCSDGCYALVAGTLGGRLRTSRFARRREVFSGCMFMGLGVAAAVAGHPTKR
jgi:threonine/homoserine/homoserine lactone efflux protein